MESNLFIQANKIWKLLVKNKSIDTLKLEVDAYRRLLSHFMVDDYYYFVFNLTDRIFDFISEGSETALGYSLDNKTVEFLLSQIHPEDQPWFLTFEK